MKCFVVLGVLALVALSAAVPHDRGCLYILGNCHHECPEGTHSYGAPYGKPWNYEPTCKDPKPKVQISNIADYSACYCDPPTVKDTDSGKCVTLDKCPQLKKGLEI